VTRVLGVDTSLRCTGYGVVESSRGSMHAVAHGCIRTKPAWNHSTCLLAILEGLTDVIRETQPQEIAIEGAFYCRNVRTAMTLGEARGVALVACAAQGIPVYEYAPRRVKMAVVGVGSAEKEQVMKMVVRLLGMEGSIQLDASDALALAITHLQQARGIVRDNNNPL
jgi:crossover junction endodeoxyribonuclease RuvC